MHSKNLGKLGEAVVIQQCLAENLDVFVDFGDNSKIDLIISTGTELHKVQVKCYTPEDGKITVYFTKSGPSYEYKYKNSDVDWFAIVNAANTQDVAWLNASEFLSKYSKSCKLRVDPTKNNQEKGINWFKNYTTFPFRRVAE